MSIWLSLITSILIILVFIMVGLFSLSDRCGFYVFDKLSYICNFILFTFVFDLGFIGMMQYFCWKVYEIFHDLKDFDNDECIHIIDKTTKYFDLVNDWIFIPSIVLIVVIFMVLIIWFISRCSNIWKKVNDHYNDYVLFSG